MNTAQAGDYEAPTLETAANPVAADGGTDGATFDVEPSGPPAPADGEVHTL